MGVSSKQDVHLSHSQVGEFTRCGESDSSRPPGV